jgi:hypothetical protein
MNLRVAIIAPAIVAIAVSASYSFADEPTTPPATKTTPKDPTSTHKLQATDIINGKVDKISDSSITVKVSYQTGGSKPNQKSNTKTKPHTVVKSFTFQIGDVPPVKVVTDGAHPTRTTGSYADVKVGDLVSVGTRPVSTKNAEGKSTVQTQVTGIDVLKHPSAANTTTSK